MATRIGGGGGTAKNIDATIKRSTKRRASAPPGEHAASNAASRSNARAQSPSMGPGGSAAMRRSDRSTRRWAATSANAPRLRKARRDLSTIPNAPRPTRRGLTLKQVTSDKDWKRSSGVRSAGFDLGANTLGFARAIGHTVGGIAETVVTNSPTDTGRKALSQAGDIAKGLMVPVAAVPYTIAYPINKAIGNDVESPVKIAKRMGESEVKRVVTEYGPSYRGEKGAYRKLQQRIEKGGVLMPALDVATAIAPVSLGGGAAVRAGHLGRGAQAAVTTRPAVRTGITSTQKSLKQQKARKSLTGQGIGLAHDAARRRVQARAVARSERAVARGEAPTLPAHRRLVASGEVAPLLNVRTGRNQRFRVAEGVASGELASRLRLRHQQALIKATRAVPQELRDLVPMAVQLGIRDARSAEAMLTERLRYIDESVERARQVLEQRVVGRDSKTEAPDEAAVKDANVLAQMDEMADERARIEELLQKPELFERPEVQAAVAQVIDVERAATTGREGMSAERAAEGRSGLVGDMLGVERAADTNAKARREHEAARAAARDAVEAAQDARTAVREAYRAPLQKAREDLAKAKGRAEVLHRNVTGRNTLGPADARYAAGGHGVREAQARLDELQSEAAERMALASDTLREAREARKEVNRTPIRQVIETAEQREVRVREAAAERGAAAPEFATSKYANDPDDVDVVTGAKTVSPANPLSKSREGSNFRLGRQANDLEQRAVDLRKTIERGAKIEAEQKVLADLGLFFRDRAEAKKFIQGLGIDPKSVDIFEGMTGGAVRKDVAEAAGVTKGKDAGDYLTGTGGVFVVPKAVSAELRALDAIPSAAGQILRRLALAPQVALLALSPAWFGYQRVNDIVGTAFGGSLVRQAELQKRINALDPDSREVAQLAAGGSVSSSLLTPRTGQTMGRMQRVLDENPTLRDALASDRPAYNLTVKLAHDAPLSLIRADAAITGRAREGQFLYNLQKFAAKADPDVAKMVKGFGPLGHALKTADVELMTKLLNDPKYEKARVDATDALNRVMGDWHNFTARERKFKAFAAFYAYLRYATRMAFYTLPVDHPSLGLLVAQLGAMGDADAKRIIGDDLPFGLGKLYQSNGELAYDLTRANPVTGPLLNLTKPEQVVSLGTPLVTIGMSWLFNTNIGLSDSATGFTKTLTVDGDPEAPGGSVLGGDRLAILGNQVFSLLTPYKVWRGWDERPQSDDSMPFNREYMQATSGKTQAKLEAKAQTGPEGGIRNAAQQLAPMIVPDSGRNYKAMGEKASQFKRDREYEERKRVLERKRKLEDPRGQVEREREMIEAELEASREEIMRDVEEAKRELELEMLELGIKAPSSR